VGGKNKTITALLMTNTFWHQIIMIEENTPK
jgi:hypothetical protein